MRWVFVAIGALAVVLLVAGLGNGLWTAINLMDGGCENCVFPGMNEPREVLVTAIVNILLYGGIIAFAVFGYRASTRKSGR